MIYLDTHVVVWLFAGIVEKFSPLGMDIINDNEVTISPITRLELQYLLETGRTTEKPQVIISDLNNRIGLREDENPFGNIVSRAVEISWTRDPFDRLIVGNASLTDEILLTKDATILANYPLARW